MTTPASSRFSFPVDHSDALQGLSKIIPEAAGPIVPLAEGDFCLAFRQGNRVLRVAKHSRAVEALRAESCVLPAIADRLPLPVPRPEHHAPPNSTPFSLHEEIQGEALTRERWLELPGAGRERTAAQLADFLGALHNLPEGTGRSCDLPVLNARDLSRRAASGEIWPLLGEEDGIRIERLLGRCAGDSAHDRRRAVLLHGDIAPGHVLYAPDIGGLTGIIDFGDLALGDPARDFIYIYEDFGSEMLGSVLAAYGQESGDSLLPRIRLWYVLEALCWTLLAVRGGRALQVHEGVDAIRRELATPGLPYL